MIIARDLEELKNRNRDAIDNITPNILSWMWLETGYCFDILHITNGAHGFIIAISYFSLGGRK